MSLPSVYRRPALALPSRKVIAYGTGERLVLGVPMPPSEVVQSLSELVQSDRPTRRELRTANHRPFKGALSPSGFRLTPLSRNTSFLEVRGAIEPRESSSVVTLDIRLRVALLWRSAAVFVGLLVIVIALTGDTLAAIYIALRIGAPMLGAAIAGLVTVRFGIANVRRRLIAALDPMAESTSPNEALAPTDRDELIPRYIKNPEEAVQRLDAWLLERFK